MKPSGRYHLYKQLWGLRLEDPSVLEGDNEDEKSVWMTREGAFVWGKSGAIDGIQE